MHTPRLREITQLYISGCCPNPLTGPPDSDQPIAPRKSTTSTCRRQFTTTTKSSFFPNTNFTNHESIPSLQQSFVQFIKTYPKYADTSQVDKIRGIEYRHLSDSNHVCLDYIGVGLFSHSQTEFPSFDITFKSVNLKSQLLHGGEGSALESIIKNRIMEFLKISQEDYSMVFTANRSSAFKLVAESYPFQLNKKLLSVYDHESEALDAMVNVSTRRGARVMSSEFKFPTLRIQSSKLRKMIVRKRKKKNYRGLFVIPLQSRMTGANYSYQWMTMAQENGWHVMLDACTLGPKEMDSFGLSLFRPDFIVCSFYKIFGENPTGFGCLFVKKSTVQILENSTSGGGIVSIAPETTTEVGKLSRIEFRCLDHVDSLGLMMITARARFLINWLISALMKLHHPHRLDDFPLVKVYGPKVKFDRGQALSFNIYDWKGEKVEPILVQKLADRSNISLGNGVLQHIWFPDKCEKEKQRKTLNGKCEQGIGVVTVALSFLANFEDVYRVWAFVAQFLDADFVEKERWRYTALNQKTIEV